MINFDDISLSEVSTCDMTTFCVLDSAQLGKVLESQPSYGLQIEGLFWVQANYSPFQEHELNTSMVWLTELY